MNPLLYPHYAIATIPTIIIYNILPYSNSFREEYGWRGFALENLLEKNHYIKSSVLIGTIWGLWHLPLYFFPNVMNIYQNIPIPIFVLDTIIISIIMTWIYENTNKSMLAMILLHTVLNVSGMVFRLYRSEYGLIIDLLLKTFLVIGIIKYYGNRRSNNSRIILNA